MLVKVDPVVRDRAVRLVRGYRAECPSTARAIEVAAREEGVGCESLRRWVLQADIGAGDRAGADQRGAR